MSDSTKTKFQSCSLHHKCSLNVTVATFIRFVLGLTKQWTLFLTTRAGGGPGGSSSSSLAAESIRTKLLYPLFSCWRVFVKKSLDLPQLNLNSPHVYWSARSGCNSVTRDVPETASKGQPIILDLKNINQYLLATNNSGSAESWVPRRICNNQF